MFLYYGIFDFNVNGFFSDLEGAYGSGSDRKEALNMAKDLLKDWILLAKEAGEPIAPASHLDLIQEKFLDRFIVPISINLELAREKHFGKPVSKH